MRNVIVHAYWEVDHDVLWRTVTDDLPTLLTTMRPLLDEIDASDRNEATLP